VKLTGKVTLITNVSQFMGPACTEEFAKEGAALALHDRTEARARPAVDVAMAYGRDVMLVAGDTILVNNSSHAPVGGPVEDVPDEAWRSLVAHLLDEPFYTMRAALRAMKRQGRGKIINITSAVALDGLPNYAAYSAARAGTNGLTRAVGREVARHGIQVNAIAQNFVENPTYFGPAIVGNPDTLARVVKHVPAGRLARSEESARLAVYLASEDADFFCGQVIPFAGGWA
jgi:2-keto-3-deoxy-L-fuconate dehydrogenase